MVRFKTFLFISVVQLFSIFFAKSSVKANDSRVVNASDPNLSWNAFGKLGIHEKTERNQKIFRNFGKLSWIPGTVVETYSGYSRSPVSGIPSVVFKNARIGRSFDISFLLQNGDYDILFGFIQGKDCTRNKRVFDVTINGNSRLESFDIYEKAGCLKPLLIQFTDQTVSRNSNGKMKISFRAVSGVASISYIRIRPSERQCTPVSRVTSSSDHLAHAVPGNYPPEGGSYIDSENKGFVTVKIDGSNSHTHAAYGSRSGQITNYRWTLPSGQEISVVPSFKYSFPVGTTKIRLSVRDDACSEHEAETTVTVTKDQQEGAYCYFYIGVSSMLRGGTLSGPKRPNFALIQRSPSFKFPRELSTKNFVMRCIFLARLIAPNSKVTVEPSGSGSAHVYDGRRKILDTSTSSTSAPIQTGIGVNGFELIYIHKKHLRAPKLNFKLNGKMPSKLYHEHSEILPIITSISPNTGAIRGGTKIRISGYGLTPPVSVFFGARRVFLQRQDNTDKELFVSAPATSQQGIVNVKVKRGKDLASNGLTYRYDDSCDDIAFDEGHLLLPSGKRVVLNQPTSITTWQNGNLYIGTRGGVLHVVGYNSHSLKVTTMCSSETFTDRRWKDDKGRPSVRSILGITFDPRDTTPRPYVSVSTIFWGRWKAIQQSDWSTAWANGAVERFKPASADTKARNPNRCIEHDRTIVRNLPVADGDHSVNEILFTQSGDLLMSIGGFTNMGLPYKSLGGRWETYFSGAVLLARLSKGNRFNGNIPYTNIQNSRTARPKSNYSDVEIYATGLRNMFSMQMIRNGRILGLDMGPNCGFGNAALTCSEYKESEAAKRKPTDETFIGGKSIVGTGKCKFSDSRPDKLVEIKRGRFYGHPNIQRSIIRNKPGECAYIDPLTHKTGAPRRGSPPSNYEPALSLVDSPKTGLREYGSNVFCGKMRGDIMLARLKSLGTWRIRLKRDGLPDGDEIKLHQSGGLRVEENIHGDLIFPKYDPEPSAGIMVLRPRVRATTRLQIKNALPFRHGRAGGTILRVGGTGFTSVSQIYVGQKLCPKVSTSATEISCRVPRFVGGNSLVSLSVRSNGNVQTLSNAILYMTV